MNGKVQPLHATAGKLPQLSKLSSGVMSEAKDQVISRSIGDGASPTR